MKDHFAVGSKVRLNLQLTRPTLGDHRLFDAPKGVEGTVTARGPSVMRVQLENPPDGWDKELIFRLREGERDD